jgi:flavorubredoxin
MRAMVIYDSWYGGTRRIAQEIARGLAETLGTDPAVVDVDHVSVANATSADVLVVGTPNHFGGPTRKIRQLARELRAEGPPRGTLVAFDTCFAGEAGKAAHKLAILLAEIGPVDALVPAEFSAVVDGTRGPLRAGELERAHGYGVHLAHLLQRAPVPLPA